MEEIALISIVVILGLGIFSQWLAWRIQWPSIVIMSIAGLLIGPILGWINPSEALGDLYNPTISLAVAIILFEGSSSLDVREIRGISKSVFRIVTWGAILAWIAGSLAAYYIAGLQIEVAFIIGGLFVVTGPTVIIPMLRQAKLKPRVAAVLKWEGIIVDPAGPLLALFAYQVSRVITNDALSFSYLGKFFFGAIIAILLGLVIGIFISFLSNRGLFPEYLKSPLILSFVLICFTISEVVMHETGMLAVTVLGLTLGWAKKYVSSISNVGHVVENISVILTSTVFILLTASLTRETIAEVFTWPIISFVLVMLFLVRPLSIWISTIRTELTIPEKTLVSWIAPRGVVALTVSGYFASVLLDDGYEGAQLLTALTFALVFITVCAHGFSIGPLSKKLNLASDELPGVLIVGASSFSIALADELKKINIPVLISDPSHGRLSQTQDLEIDTFRGEVLSEHAQYNLDLTPYETILVMTGDASYNALVSQSYVPEFGFNKTFSLIINTNNQLKSSNIPLAQRAHLLFNNQASFVDLNRKINTGYTIQSIRVETTETILLEDFDYSGIPLFIRKSEGNVEFVSLRRLIKLEENDQLFVLAK